MAKKLPFKTAPKQEIQLIGNERVGELEFPVLGDITVREQAYINDNMGKRSTFLELARIANKVAKAEKIQPVAAHKFLTKCATSALQPQLGLPFGELEENWKVKYAREIEQLCEFLLKEQWERQCITAAALIRYRLEGMEDFEVDDARDMSQILITGIYAFSMMEMNAGADVEAEPPTEEEIEEDLGK